MSQAIRTRFLRWLVNTPVMKALSKHFSRHGIDRTGRWLRIKEETLCPLCQLARRVPGP